MVDMDTAVGRPAAAPKKPSKFMADLTTAMQTTAEAAREQALAQVETDAKASSSRSASARRRARRRSSTRPTTTSRRSASGRRPRSPGSARRPRAGSPTRKATLEDEIDGHAAAIERRVEQVQVEVTRFEEEMAAFFERLGEEDDPASFATMAENLPEPPSFEAWADLDTLDITLAAAPALETISDPWATPETEAVADAGRDRRAAAKSTRRSRGRARRRGLRRLRGRGRQTVEAQRRRDRGRPAVEAARAGRRPGSRRATPPHADPWTSETAWGQPARRRPDASSDDAPRWADSDTPTPWPADGGDRSTAGAIMAALEAAAEAVAAPRPRRSRPTRPRRSPMSPRPPPGLLVGRTGADADYRPRGRGRDARTRRRRRLRDRRPSRPGSPASCPNHGEGSADDAAAHDAGRRLRARQRRQHRELQAPSRPPGGRPVRRRLVRARRRVRVRRHPSRRPLVPRRDPDHARLRRSRHRHRRRCRATSPPAIPSPRGRAPMSTAIRPAVAVLLPDSERDPVALELHNGGLDPIVVRNARELGRCARRAARHRRRRPRRRERLRARRRRMGRPPRGAAGTSRRCSSSDAARSTSST